MLQRGPSFDSVDTSLDTRQQVGARSNGLDLITEGREPCLPGLDQLLKLAILLALPVDLLALGIVECAEYKLGGKEVLVSKIAHVDKHPFNCLRARCNQVLTVLTGCPKWVARSALDQPSR